MVFGLLRRKKKKTTRRKSARRKTSRSKTTRRKVKRRTVRRKTSRRKTKRKGKPFGGYEIMPDEHLARIVGRKPVSPSQMTKNLWSYIKRKRLARK